MSIFFLDNLLATPKTPIELYGGTVLTNDYAANTVTPNGVTTSVRIVRSPGITQTLFAWGNFGGGVLTIQYSPDNGTTWIDDASTLANGFRNISIDSRNQAILIRASLADSTNAKLNIYIL
jgi:hypothetical protein